MLLRHVRIVLPNQGACTIAMLTMDDAQWLVAREVYDKLLGKVPWTKFYQELTNQANNPKTCYANGRVMTMLKEGGVIKPRTSIALLATHATILTTLQALCVDSMIVESLGKTLHGSSPNANTSFSPSNHATTHHPPPLPKTTTSPNHTPKANLIPLPPTLPKVNFKWPKQKHYGLKGVAKHLLVTPPLVTQLNEMEEWCTINVDLTRQGSTIEEATWENVYNSIALYLGFLLTFKGIIHPTLEYFLQGPMFMEYIAFHKDKGSMRHTIQGVISHGIKVVHFLKANAKGVNGDGYDGLVASMTKLRTQIGEAMVHNKKRDSSHLEEQGQWVGAKGLLGLVHGYVKDVFTLLEQEGPRTMEVARMVHDALLASIMFGWIPSLRPTCVRTLVGPSHVGECHLGKGCKRGAQCKGNQVIGNGGQGYTIHIPHHKVAKKWRGQAITFKLPKDPQGLMDEHVGWGHKVSSAHVCEPLPH
jgi:hypothetical protein